MKQISVTLVTGFLGAGKTTFINRLLHAKSMSGTIVVVNEFGEVGLDHLLVEGSDDTILELSNGCICCSIRGALIDTLVDLLDQNPQRIIVETTGIADPLPILQSLATHSILSTALEPVAVLTVLDGHKGFETNEDHEEFLQQLALANQIVVSKTDLISEDKISRLREAITKRVRTVNTVAGLTFIGEVLSGQRIDDLLNSDIQLNHVTFASSRKYKNSSHTDRYETLALCHSIPIPTNVISRFIEFVLTNHSSGLLRIKGLVFTRETPEEPLVIQGVGAVLDPLVLLDSWGANEPATKLVIITKDVDTKPIERLFHSFVGNPQVDTPDMMAVQDNPLAIPGT